MRETDHFLYPDWPAPARVRALVTTRLGGVSRAPWESFNLGTHVGDDPASVAENRRRLRQHLPTEPHWLEQVHGIEVAAADAASPVICADASLTRQPGAVCVVMTADCLPVLFCDTDGRVVAAAHAGWRGLAAGVLESTLARMDVDPARVLAWLGPAIGPTAFEVGDEVRAAFIALDPAGAAFVPTGQPGKWLADIFLLARQCLKRAGVEQIFGGSVCTVFDPERFYSYRRDGVCGRIASLVWLADN